MGKENQNQGVNEEALFSPQEVNETELTQESITASILGNQNPNNPPTPAPGSEGTEETFEAYIENTIKAVNPEYKLPEYYRTGKKADGTPMTAREKHELLTQEIIANTEIEGDDDDFTRQYKQAKAAGIDANSFVNQYNSRINLLNMPSAEFIKTAYRSMVDAKGERKYSDEDIDKLVEGKSQIELDQYAAGMKRQYAQVQFQKMNQSNVESIEADNKKYQPVVDSYVQKLKSESTIYGFELSAEEKETLGNEVSKMFVRSTKDGMNDFERMMSDDNFVLQIAPIILMVKNGKYQSAMTAMKEAIKAKVYEKIDPNPQNPGGGGVAQNNVVDEGKLYQ